ncbi:HNH endonuclease domain-containing protein [Streptococcus mitis]|uniref:HNH endonuclease n=1 Tax=Streptococcus mitis TaxID=28037 RepID=A0A3R9IPR3_STRMT|nr:HNH endonuclease domain-containing protein [Streptococcus mitis]RSI86217.1 HNH endonuclease [Streptococcus mitis]
MLKIFRSDINQLKLNELHQLIKRNILRKINSNDSVKAFLTEFFDLEQSQIPSFISDVLGEINDGEEIFQTNVLDNYFFKQYHKLFEIIDELSRLKNMKSKEEIKRSEFNKGVNYLLSLNDLIDELEMVGSNFRLEKIYDISREEVDLPRVKKERKEEVFCKIYDLYTNLYDLHDILKKINKIFSYTKNISPVRSLLASYIKINSCPYCNLELLYLTEIELGDNETQISAYCELDHILPQSKYPLFASSIWNLVPVCKDCNSNKSDKLISFNSWLFDLDNEKFKIKILYDKTKAILEYMNGRGHEEFNISGIEISANNPAVKEDIKILDLNARYSAHMKSMNSNQFLTLMIDGLRKSTSMSISDLLNITNAKDPSSVFSYYFKIMFCDYKEKHYNTVTYGKLISEFLRENQLDESLFEL